MDDFTTTSNPSSSEPTPTPTPNMNTNSSINKPEASNLNNAIHNPTDIKSTSNNPTFVSRTQQKLFLQKDRWKSEIDTPSTPPEHMKLMKELERIHKEFQALLRLEGQPVQTALTRILGPIPSNSNLVLDS